MTLTVSRKQRLRTLENDIRKRAEDIQKNGLEIGRDLCEIRDDELWKDEFPSWNQYLKERAGELVGKSFERAQFLMEMTEVAERLPVATISAPGKGITPKHLEQIKRLAPPDKDDERKKDLSRLRKADVARVLDTAKELAGGEAPSVRDVRKAVDQELGIDRAAKAAATIEKRDAGVDLADYLIQCRGRIEGITENLEKVPSESWTLLEDSHPGLATRVAKACDTLAKLLRS